MNKYNLENESRQQLKKAGWQIITAIVLTLTAIITVYVYAAFIEPTVGPTDSDQDFAQNILGANNANNDFDSSLVTASSTGSIIERLEYITNRMTTAGQWYSTECGESTTSTQTTCYVDDTARYLTTDLCNEAKENQCFVPTNNSYYAFGSECADSTTTTKTNCYVDDTAKYINANACSAASNNGYCYMNTATFSAMDADLTAANILSGKTIFGVAGSVTSYPSPPSGWSGNCVYKSGDESCPSGYPNKHTRVVYSGCYCTGGGAELWWNCGGWSAAQTCSGQDCWTNALSPSYDTKAHNVAGSCNNYGATTYTYCCQ
ncbi:MAG: hypothetical protein PHZ04_03455 [Patescibacteria group bacterium]|nr:hypothetical protein [Patescibacteria group bacterium]MDD5295251.1 hypothetical protein [Patescibacteria group bacterium]MDD5554572.1 hypothetical protein [Patescibacteria group bacterium]